MGTTDSFTYRKHGTADGRPARTYQERDISQSGSALHLSDTADAPSKEAERPYRHYDRKLLDHDPNRKNPYLHDRLRFLIWQALWWSNRPANSPSIHVFGRFRDEIDRALMMYPEWHPVLRPLSSAAKHGLLNSRSTVLSAENTDTLSRRVGLSHNIWGCSLRLDEPDFEIISPEA